MYPGETARTSGTTAGGTAFTDVSVTISGDKARVLIPNTVQDGATVNAGMFLHGSGRTQTYINDTEPRATRDGLLDRGYVLIGPHASGESWGNAIALGNLTAAYEWTQDQWAVNAVVVHGASMGGLLAANAVSNSSVPRLAAAVMIDPAVNLRAAYDKGSWNASIEAAYGMTSGAPTWDTATAGHDPSATDPELFSGVPLFVTSSTADVWIPKAQHSDVFVPRVQPVTTVEYVTTSGAHVAAANYVPGQVLPWIDAQVTAYLPPPVQGDGIKFRRHDGAEWVSINWRVHNGTGWTAP